MAIAARPLEAKTRYKSSMSLDSGNSGPLAAPPPRADRVVVIDRLRGLVIMLMALDHVRDFFDADSLRFRPTDLSHTYPALFFTRIATHLCAPTFVMLAGVSAYLHGVKLADRGAQAKFLASRGLWLILLDAFLISPVWTGTFGRIELGVLWAIGCGMIVLAAMVFAPARAAPPLGLVLVAGHNAFDGLHAAGLGALEPAWRLLHEPGPLPFGVPGHVVYPAAPWVGAMLIGYGLGPLFVGGAQPRERLFPKLGVATLALFALLRFFNVYGDPKAYEPQASALYSAMAFLNVTKYPPSLLYFLLTLGVAFLLLWALERRDGALSRLFDTFGRAPLFFYIAHLYAALLGAAALAYLRGFSLNRIGAFVASGEIPPDFGVGLAGAYLVWILLLALLYPVCRWFGQMKRSSRARWLSYL